MIKHLTLNLNVNIGVIFADLEARGSSTLEIKKYIICWLQDAP